MNKILVILGPTSSGKSDIAIKLAKKFNGEIISADSRQIFRGMDIGTGKVKGRLVEIRSLRSRRDRIPTIYVSHGVPHHMIDIVSPRTNFNAAKFKKRAEKIIANILQRGKLPIVCGGTGFWIQAIVDDVNFPEVKPDWKLRARLEKHSVERLFAMLKKLDPARAKDIDAKNKVRLIRAIEICKAIGRVPKIPAFAKATAGKQDTKYYFLQVGLKLSREKLYNNIEKRVKARFKQGMIKEVESLHVESLSWKKIQSFGLAYLWIPLFLQKKPSFGELRASASKEKSLALEKDELFQKVIQAEKNYAKRQMTWFRRDKRIKWLANYKEIKKTVQNFLK